VLKVSENLVNNLSEASRQQMTAVANRQVARSEERLRKVREEIRHLRAQQQTIDPTMMAKSEAELQNQLQSQMASLETRYNTLLQSVDKNAPSANSLRKQISALAQQLSEQKQRLGDPNVKTSKLVAGEDRTNISAVLNKFEELTVDQDFATKAYVTSLAAFETALAEVQKQERYFATFVSPTRPEIALYPMRLLDSFIALLVFLAVWMISQFLYRSFRDHAI
jgi:capsular polysaccharide transport system permease protein